MPENERFTKRGRFLSQPSHDDHYTKKGRWSIFESPFASYMDDFSRLENYPGEIIDLLRSKRRPVIIDLLSSTATLRNLKHTVLKDREMRALAVGLTDNRSSEEKALDASLGITYTAGNLRRPNFWEGIDNWLGEEVTDFIFQRGAGGLTYLPTRPIFAVAAISEVWEMLNPDGGYAFLQTPPADALEENGIEVNKWASQLRQARIPSWFVPDYSCAADNNLSYGLLRLDRTPQSPELPVVQMA